MPKKVAKTILSSKMKILIIAGEISSDIYGAQLARALSSKAQPPEVYAIGGPHLKAVATKFLYQVSGQHAIGIYEIFKQKKFFKKFFKLLPQILEKEKFTCAVIIDFPYYHFKIAHILRQYQIPITTFITPNFWIWQDQKKALKLVRYSTNIITIFPQEYAFYKQFTNQVFYFGHPLLNLLKPMPPKTPTTYKVITLFPGSRKQEIEYLLPKMLETALYLTKQDIPYKFYLAVSDPVFLPQIQALLDRQNLNIELWTKDIHDLYHISDFGICATGTVSLEAILYKTPVAVLGAVSFLTYFLAKYILKLNIKFVALPNIVADYQIVPEYTQTKIQPALIAQEIRDFFQDPSAQTRFLTQADHIKQSLSQNHNVFQEISNLLLSS